MGGKTGLFLGKIKKEYLIYGLLGGILLLVIALPVKTGSSNSVQEETSVGTRLEEQLTQALTRMESIGKVWVTITMEPYTENGEAPEIRGVLVVCENGKNSVVIAQIIDAAQVLFQIEAHKIKVIKMR